MGIVGSVSGNVVSQQFACIVADEVLQQAGVSLQNETTRASFVRYVSNRDWLNHLKKYGATRRDIKHIHTSVWKNYGYRDSCHEDCEVSFHVPGEINDTENTHIQQTVFIENIDRISLLVSILYPLFVDQVVLEKENAMTTNSKEDDEKVHPTSKQVLHPDLPRESDDDASLNRLQVIIDGIVTSIKDTEIEAYLANTKTDIIGDLQRAFMNLPVEMMIGKINPPTKQSPIVYMNFELSVPDRTTKRRHYLNQDLHVVCGNTCSPGTALQLQRAVFTGKAFKTSHALPYKTSKLLAVLPIRSKSSNSSSSNSSSPTGESITNCNAYSYVVSLESEIFSCNVDAAQAMQYFQQVEDLMLLLPLLIRT